MSFTEEALIPHLTALDGSGLINQYWIAYSGGLDSHVLLLALHKLLNRHAIAPHPIVALHINHGISPNSDAWQTHCQQVCEDLNISFVARKVEIDQSCSQSLEKVARDARYTVFDELLDKGDCLLMGHHQNDQCETILYRLMRGAGPRGLGAIPAQRKLAKGQLLRPLLSFTRLQLESYAQANHLNWIEDESNQDTDFDRNFLRQEILPRLKQRWPDFEKNWQRSAQLCAEADQLQMVLGEQDLEQVKTAHLNRLNLLALTKFDELRQRNILRTWFSHLEVKYSLPMPDFKSLQRILKEVIPASIDASPLVCWSNDSEEVQVRRFANELYALKPLAFNPPDNIDWPLDEGNCELSPTLGQLRLTTTSDQGIDLSGVKAIKVAFRQGGEEVKVAGRKTRSLKKVFQDYKVPPWLRDKVPLIFIDDELVAVGDLFICDAWQTKTAENLQRFCWERSDIHCGY